MAAYSITRNIKEPVWTITRQDDEKRTLLAFIGAETREEALHRATTIRHQVPEMPYRELLQAQLHEAGPICGAPFFANEYFAFIESLVDGSQGTCPTCGGELRRT